MAVSVYDNSSIILGESSDGLVRVSEEGLESGSLFLGKQGSGKSFLLLHVALQKIEQGEGIFVVDPHGDLCNGIIARMSERRIADTYLLDVQIAREYPFGMNIFALSPSRRGSVEAKEAVRNGVLHAFGKVWKETITGLYFEKTLRHVVDLMVDCPELTMAHIPRLLQETAFRQQYTRNCRSVLERSFWRQFDQLSASEQKKETKPLLDRLDKLLSDDVVSHALCQKGRRIDLREAILERKIILINLHMNKPGYEEAGKKIGTFFTAGLQSAIFDMDDRTYNERTPFTVIVDEFSNFGSDTSYEVFLAQARKMRCQLILATQYLGQVGKEGATAMKESLSTCHTRVCMSCNDSDAKSMASSFTALPKRVTNLYIDPVDRLGTHPSPLAKEFVMHYLNTLREAAKLKPETEIEEVDWSFSEPPVKIECEILPWYDLGFGTVKCDPKDVQKVLQDLNQLLYDVQRDGNFCDFQMYQWIIAYGTLVGLAKTVEVETEEYKKAATERNLITSARRQKKERAKAEFDTLRDQTYAIERQQRKLNDEEETYGIFLHRKEYLEQRIKAVYWDALEGLTYTYSYETRKEAPWSEFMQNLLTTGCATYRSKNRWIATKRAVFVEENIISIILNQETWDGYCRGEEIKGTHRIYHPPKEDLDIEAIYEEHGFTSWVMNFEQRYDLQQRRKDLQAWHKEAIIEKQKHEERMKQAAVYERQLQALAVLLETARQAHTTAEKISLYEGLASLPKQYRKETVEDPRLETVKTLLRGVIEALIAYPIAIDKSEYTPAELEVMLKNLEKREALVKIGGRVQRMRTVNVEKAYPALGGTRLQYRIATIVHQTMQKYCQPWEVVEREIEEAYTGNITCEEEYDIRVIEADLVTTRRGEEQAKISEGAMLFSAMPSLREISGWDFSDTSEY